MNIKEFVKEHKAHIIIGGATVVGAAGTVYIWSKLHSVMTVTDSLIVNENGFLCNVGILKEYPGKVAIEWMMNGADHSNGIFMEADKALDVAKSMSDVATAIKAGTETAEMFI